MRVKARVLLGLGWVFFRKVRLERAAVRFSLGNESGGTDSVVKTRFPGGGTWGFIEKSGKLEMHPFVSIEIRLRDFLHGNVQH